MIQRHKAHPDQAGFFRRFAAFMVDSFIIMFISIIIFFTYSEIAAARKGEKGEFSRLLDALEKGESVVVRLGNLQLGAMGKGEKVVAHPGNLSDPETASDRNKKMHVIGGEMLNIIYEFLIGYIYYVLFFRFGGRTPGKRLLRLQVVDLTGRPRLGWYQSLERAHGYAASTLLIFLGFLQVLWDHEGLTMHDKLAGTTVIRLKKKDHN